MTNYLLLPSERYIEFPFWCLVRLFDETVKNNDLSSNHGAEKRSSNSFFCLGTDLKKAITKRACMRHSQVGTVFFHAYGQCSKSSTQANWPSIKLSLDSFIVI